MLMIRQAPSSIAAAASAADRIDSSRQIAVRICACSFACSTRSSWCSGCSTISRSNASSARKTSTSSSVYAAFASTDSEDVGMRAADRAHPFDIQARLDLQLDAPVALGEVRRPPAPSSSSVDRRDPDRDAARDAILVGAQVLGERSAGRAELGVQEGVDQRGLRHRVAADARQDAIEIVRRDVAGREQRREQEIAEHQPGAVVELLGIAGVGARHALAPTLRVVGDRRAPAAQVLWVSSPKLVRNGRTSGMPTSPELDGADRGHRSLGQHVGGVGGERGRGQARPRSTP